jgi:hypothetical protein
MAGHTAESQIGGKSLLFIAVESSRVQTVQVLFSHGADPNFQQSWNMTTWQYVLGLVNEVERADTRRAATNMLNKWAQIIQIFLENGADPGVDIYGVTLDVLIRHFWGRFDRRRAHTLLDVWVASKKTYRVPLAKDKPSKSDDLDCKQPISKAPERKRLGLRGLLGRSKSKKTTTT